MGFTRLMRKFRVLKHWSSLHKMAVYKSDMLNVYAILKWGRNSSPTIPFPVPVPTIRHLRWRTGGEGGGARPRTARTTTSPAPVRTAGGRGLRVQRAEWETPSRQSRQQLGWRRRATWSPSVWVAQSGAVSSRLTAAAPGVLSRLVTVTQSVTDAPGPITLTVQELSILHSL